MGARRLVCGHVLAYASCRSGSAQCVVMWRFVQPSGGRGLQPGDWAQAAQAILAALDADEPPPRLVLGGDAIDSIRARLDQVAGELGR